MGNADDITRNACRFYDSTSIPRKVPHLLQGTCGQRSRTRCDGGMAHHQLAIVLTLLQCLDVHFGQAQVPIGSNLLLLHCAGPAQASSLGGWRPSPPQDAGRQQATAPAAESEQGASPAVSAAQPASQQGLDDLIQVRWSPSR